MSDLQCPSCGQADQARIAGHIYPSIWDGIACWTCRDCGHEWHRFGEGDWRRERVQAMWDRRME